MSYNPPVPGTGITAVAGPQLWSVRVFYQLLDDHVDQSVHQGGVWNKEELQTSPVSASPLASISWNDGKEVSGLRYIQRYGLTSMRVGSRVLSRLQLHCPRTLLH